MASKNKMKKLGVAAVILMVAVCASALAIALASFLKGGDGGINSLLEGVIIEKEKDPKLRWQTEDTEEDITVTLKTSAGDITFKLDGSAASERLIESAAKFGGEEFATAAENLFIQVPALSGDTVPYEESGLGCFYGAVGFATENGKVYDSLVIIAAKELSGLSRAYISGENFDPERAEFYGSFGGVPEYEGKVEIFGQVIEGFDVLEKIAFAETSGYTGGYVPAQPVSIISVTVSYPKPKGQLE